MGQGDTLYNTCHDPTQPSNAHPNTNTASASHSLLLDSASLPPAAGQGTASSQSQLLLDASAAADALAEGVTETASPFLLLVEAADLDEVHQDGSAVAAAAGKTSGLRPLNFHLTGDGQLHGNPPAWGLPMILPRSGNLDLIQRHRREAAAAASDVSNDVAEGAPNVRAGKGVVRCKDTPTSSAFSLPRQGGDVMPEHSSRDAKHGVSCVMIMTIRRRPSTPVCAQANCSLAVCEADHALREYTMPAGLVVPSATGSQGAVKGFCSKPHPTTVHLSCSWVTLNLE